MLLCQQNSGRTRLVRFGQLRVSDQPTREAAVGVVSETWCEAKSLP